MGLGIFSVTAVAATADQVTIALAGMVREEALPEIARSISTSEEKNARISLDLSEVTLIDRTAARFFAEQMERGIELRDCPSYLEAWIVRELKHE
jgi:ABC-type transporter Mla MlaB component